MKITLLYQVSQIRKKKNIYIYIKSWDQQNYLVRRGFCYIRPLYNEWTQINYNTSHLAHLKQQKLDCAWKEKRWWNHIWLIIPCKQNKPYSELSITIQFQWLVMLPFVWGLQGACELGNFYDFWPKPSDLIPFSPFWHKQSFLSKQTKDNSNAVDFNECHSKEVMSFKRYHTKDSWQRQNIEITNIHWDTWTWTKNYKPTRNCECILLLFMYWCFHCKEHFIVLQNI